MLSAENVGTDKAHQKIKNRFQGMCSARVTGHHHFEAKKLPRFRLPTTHSYKSAYNFHGSAAVISGSLTSAPQEHEDLSRMKAHAEQSSSTEET